MLKWSLYFFIIALIAGALGYSGIAQGAATIAQVIFSVFLLLFVATLVLGLTLYRRIR